MADVSPAVTIFAAHLTNNPPWCILQIWADTPPKQNHDYKMNAHWSREYLHVISELSVNRRKDYISSILFLK